MKWFPYRNNEFRGNLNLGLQIMVIQKGFRGKLCFVIVIVVCISHIVINNVIPTNYSYLKNWFLSTSFKKSFQYVMVHHVCPPPFATNWLGLIKEDIALWPSVAIGWTFSLDIYKSSFFSHMWKSISSRFARVIRFRQEYLHCSFSVSLLIEGLFSTCSILCVISFCHFWLSYFGNSVV